MKTEMKAGLEDKMEAGQEKMKVGQEEINVRQEEMKVGQEEIYVRQEEMKVRQEEMKVRQEEMNAGLEKNMEAGKERMEKVQEEMKDLIRAGKEEVRAHVAGQVVGIKDHVDGCLDRMEEEVQGVKGNWRINHLGKKSLHKVLQQNDAGLFVTPYILRTVFYTVGGRVMMEDSVDGN
ncbi:hypothetical protein AVEN_262043-1 [Araneus ventricosus]|uniref:Uncharacterized protein n=1 Tax=Araneus ventricosus TaxID=182803 RepID=A0A4Y2WBC6_ARAVE|nr:hypothetical protein AVEN_243240-1 [Araneus ventricosus]GBO33788.1 hypothetical protein AVEN_262043-1 [Araneus ventricosus]